MKNLKIIQLFNLKNDLLDEYLVASDLLNSLTEFTNLNISQLLFVKFSI